MFNPIDAQTGTFPARKPATLPALDSTAILAMDVETVAFLCEPYPAQWRYQLSEGELGWLDWIGDRYSVAVVIRAALDRPDDGPAVLTVDDDLVMEIGEALADDGADRAPCLSDDTALQRIVWCIGPTEAD